MKILQTCISLSWGGMEMYTLQTSNLLKKAGHEVELLCVEGSRLKSESEKAGIICRAINSKQVSYKSIRNITAWIKENNYDVVHAEASKDLWLLVPSLFFAHSITPLFLTKHVGSSICKKDILHKILYKRVDTALAISEVIKTNLMETTPLREEKIKLLHDSIDAKRFDPNKADRKKIRKEFNIKDEEIVIGMTGRFSPGKGHEEFLKTAKEVSLLHNNLLFMIVGEASRGEEEYAEKIKNMAYELGLGSKIIFTGFRKDIPDVLAAMDIYLFPSRAEAFGLALVEAMSMEKPTVCSNSDGVLDIAVDGTTSLVFTPGEISDMKEKIELLIEDPLRRNKFGKEGRKRVLKNFDTNRFTKDLLNIYYRQLFEKAFNAPGIRKNYWADDSILSLLLHKYL